MSAIPSSTIVAPNAGDSFSSILPTGTILNYAGSTAPSGWLMTDGTAVSRTTYANLFAVIGTTYGAGNGSTTFNLPNIGDRMIRGKGSTYATLGGTGGADTQTLVTGNLPDHTHLQWTAGTGGSIVSSSGSINLAGTSFNVNTLATTGVRDASGNAVSGGLSQAFSIANPYIVLNYIIKAF